MSTPPDDSPEAVAEHIRTAIQDALPGARVEVAPASPGHFVIDVASDAFADEPLVRQQQRVYQAIAPLMSGDAPPVHAIDQLRTRVP